MSARPVLAAISLLCPSLFAQQYCFSGNVTSILSCNNCLFKVGDPVAVTVSLKAGSVTCTIQGIQSACIANAAFSVNIGTRKWTTMNDTDPYTGAATAGAITSPGLSSTRGSFVGGAKPIDGKGFGGILSLTFESSSNLISDGKFPAALPPSAFTTTAFAFTDLDAGGNPHFSYTGQDCATTNAQPLPSFSLKSITPLYSSSNLIQPGSWISIFGTNLASGTATWNNDFPTTLGGTSVTIDGKPAYLWYVSPTQINLQAPDDFVTGLVPVVVTTANGSSTDFTSLTDTSPSFSRLDGKHVAGIILRSDGSGAFGGGSYDVIGPPGTSLGYKTVPAKAGDNVTLFGVGFGPTNPTVPAGKPFTGAAPATQSVIVNIGGAIMTPSFSGLTSAGLYQLNLTIPAGLPTGDVPLQAFAGATGTGTGATIFLQ